MRVLVVDDDNNLRSVLRAAMEHRGCDVEEAGDGAEALRRISADHYDAAVVDYQLPPPDGLEILRQLRTAQPRCVRVLMSGALDLPVVMGAVNRGEVSRLVAKPFRLEALFNALEEALAERGRLEQIYGRAQQDVLEQQRRELDACLGSCMLQLAVQPLIEAGSGTLHGYEALLRSRHPTLNTPLRVLAAAETHDMLGPLADWIALAAADWLNKLPQGLLLFINAHPRELADLAAVKRRFEPLRAAANRLVIEITERSNLLEETNWRTAILWLSQAGFRIAIDDLGSGYNSLAVLAELQPAFLKVDMSIVRNIDREERKQRLVELLTRFAQATGSRVVLEGIETEAEATTARRLGVDLLQGYLFGRPALSV